MGRLLCASIHGRWSVFLPAIHMPIIDISSHSHCIAVKWSAYHCESLSVSQLRSLDEDRLKEPFTGRGSKGRGRNRRQRNSCGPVFSSVSLPGNPDLLTVPGVGPKNLRKLVQKGIEGVAQLKQLYKLKFYGESYDKMVDFLQSSVGIIHRNHAESITAFVKETVDEESKQSVLTNDSTSSQKRVTFCVEGNISVGKTTFLQRIANETLELRDIVEVVPEPVAEWQNVGPDHFNILDAFYSQPQRYAYTFQNYVFVTRVMQERKTACGVKPLRLMERSVFSDRMVSIHFAWSNAHFDHLDSIKISIYFVHSEAFFWLAIRESLIVVHLQSHHVFISWHCAISQVFVRAVHEAKWMNDMEICIYDSWFDPVVSCLPGLIPDGFIYLRASPDTCHQRLKLRKRAEEGRVSLDYLRDLHEKHENWLFPFQQGNNGILSVSHIPLCTHRDLHPDIRDRIFFLEGNHLHPSIQKVPALVLDCESYIDFSKDVEAKCKYARQVAEFFAFVKQKKQSFCSPESAQRSLKQTMVKYGNASWRSDNNPATSNLISLNLS